MPVINTPSGPVNFPDNMPMDEIKSVLQRKFPNVGGAEATIRSATQGLTRGFFDEFSAGMDAPGMALRNLYRRKVKGENIPARGIGDAYSDALEMERSRLQAGREQHPYLSTAGEIVGGAVPIIASGGASLARDVTSKGVKEAFKQGMKQLPGNVARGAMRGGVEGGIYGFGSGEGGFENRLGQAKQVGKIGATIGGAVPAVAPFVVGTARGVKAIPGAVGRKLAGDGAQEISEIAARQNVPVTAGMVGSESLQAVEDLAGRTGTAAGPVVRARRATIDAIHEGKKRISDSFGTAKTREEAAGAAEEGMRKMQSEFHDAYAAFDEELDKFIPKTESISVKGALQKVDDLLGEFEDEDQVRAVFGNELFTLRKAIKNGTASPKTIRRLRRKYRGIQKSLSADPEQKEAAHELINVFTDDIRNAADQAGPGAKALFDESDKFYSEGKKVFEPFRKVLRGEKKNEELYNTFETSIKSGKSQDIGKLNQLRRAIPQEDFDEMVSFKLRDMATETVAGTEQFSPAKFVTEYGKMSPSVKSLVFSGKGKNYVKDLDELVKLSSAIPSKIANNSGTAGQMGMLGQAAGSAFLLQSSPVAAVGVLAGPYAAATLLESPVFTRWLVNTVKAGPKAYSSRMGLLQKLAAQNPAIAGAINRFIGGEGE